MPRSPRFSLNRDDVKALAWGAVKVAAGAVAEYILEWATHQEWGAHKGLVMAAVAGALDLVHKFLAGPPKGKP